MTKLTRNRFVKRFSRTKIADGTLTLSARGPHPNGYREFDIGLRVPTKSDDAMSSTSYSLTLTHDEAIRVRDYLTRLIKVTERN